MNIFWMFRIQISTGKGSLGFSQPAWVVIVVKKPCIYFKSFLFDHLFMSSDYGPWWCLSGGRQENDQIAKNRAGYPTSYHVSIQQSQIWQVWLADNFCFVFYMSNCAIWYIAKYIHYCNLRGSRQVIDIHRYCLKKHYNIIKWSDGWWWWRWLDIHLEPM